MIATDSALHRGLLALPLLGMLLGSPALAATAPRNLLINGDFETPLEGHPWMPAGWDTSQAGLESVFFGRDTFLVHGGSYAVSVANVSAIYPFSHNWSQSILIGREAWRKDVVLSVWTRSNGLDGRGYVMVQVFRDSVTRLSKQWGLPREDVLKRIFVNTVDDTALVLGWKREAFTENETGWVHRQVRVYVPPSADCIYVRCGLLGTGQVIFDDASLTLEPARTPAPAPLHVNLLANPDFEQGATAWELSIPPYEALHVGPDSSVAHSGKFSIGMWGGAGGWVKARTGVCQAICNRSLAGKRVRLTGYIKTDSLKSVGALMLYAHTGHSVVQGRAPEAFSDTHDWTKTSMEMNLPADTYVVWAWFFYSGPAPGRAWFDDASLEVIGPSTERRAPRAR